MWKLAPTPVTWASQSQSFLISTWLFENGVTQIEGDRPYGRFWWDIFNREVYEKGWGFLCLLQLFNLCSTFLMSPLSSYKPFLFIKISAEKKCVHFRAHAGSLHCVFGITGQLSGLTELFIPQLKIGSGCRSFESLCSAFLYPKIPGDFQSSKLGVSVWHEWQTTPVLYKGELKHSGVRVVSEKLNRGSTDRENREYRDVFRADLRWDLRHECKL